MDTGNFGFMNDPHSRADMWHGSGLDHTQNDGTGYMYIANLGKSDSEMFRYKIDNLCIGVMYEFSAYLTNIVSPGSYTENWDKPNFRFEVRTATVENQLLADSTTGEIPTYETMTWSKYGVSFIASHSSIVLLMIATAGVRSDGNDVAIDDIELRVCSDTHSGICFPGECIHCSSDSIFLFLYR